MHVDLPQRLAFELGARPMQVAYAGYKKSDLSIENTELG
jgi:hypothetical protein